MYSATGRAYLSDPTASERSSSYASAVGVGLEFGGEELNLLSHLGLVHLELCNFRLQLSNPMRVIRGILQAAARGLAARARTRWLRLSSVT